MTKGSSHFVLLLGFVTAHLASTCYGCSCSVLSFAEQYSIAQEAGRSFANATVLASVLRTVPGDVIFNRKRAFLLRVDKVFGNCSAPTPYYTVAETADNDGMCGIELSLNEAYILPLYPKKTSLIGICDGIRRTSTLPAAQLQFLNSRPVCCNGTCTCPNSPQVQCIRAPCVPRFEKPPCPAAKFAVASAGAVLVSGSPKIECLLANHILSTAPCSGEFSIKMWFIPPFRLQSRKRELFGIESRNRQVSSSLRSGPNKRLVDIRYIIQFINIPLYCIVFCIIP